jgi:hypothetical protein
MPARYFEIGFPKTGTTSLFQAMRMLGFSATHTLIEDANRPWDRRPAHAQRILERWLNDSYDFDVVADYEYVGSIFFPVFDEIDVAFPGSRFILTTRDPRSWVRSARRFLTGYRFLDMSRPLELNLGMVVRLSTLGFFTTEDESKLLRAFSEHERRVRDHFAGTDRLLVLDVCGGEGWEKLCPFVGRDVPGEPFPHANRTPVG